MKLVFNKHNNKKSMGLFDDVKHTAQDKFELSTVEKYLYLPYYCFIDDGYNGREIGVFFDVYFSVLRLALLPRYELKHSFGHGKFFKVIDALARRHPFI